MGNPIGLQREVFVWALGVVSQLHRIPFDPQLLLRQYPPPYHLASLQQALKGLDLKVSHKKISPQKLPKAVLPCVAVLKPAVIAAEEGDQPENQDTQPTHSLALILQSDGERQLVLEPGQQTPQALTVEEFTQR